jgi:hypothetical protein
MHLLGDAAGMVNRNIIDGATSLQWRRDVDDRSQCTGLPSGSLSPFIGSPFSLTQLSDSYWSKLIFWEICRWPPSGARETCSQPY